jgi:hypothetical protein
MATTSHSEQPMRIDEMLKLAQSIVRRAARDEIADRLARAVLDLLGESQPCGWEAPSVTYAHGESGVCIPRGWGNVCVLPDDARAMARMLWTAADQADQAKGGGGGDA